MAFIQANFMSTSLLRTVTVNVILPADKPQLPGMQETLPEKFPALYLLHGVMGNYTDWINGTAIQRWAEEKNLAVIMPSGENGFYVDNEAMHSLYGEFMGKELVEITRKMFPLSDRREDTFIAGLSMGGYGALRNGLKYSDTFSHIAGLSSALIIDGLEERTNDHPFHFERRDYAEAVFGDLSVVKESDKNPEWLARQKKAEGAQLPRIYMACGTEDFLLKPNQKLRDAFLEEGLDLTYEEGPGGHEWDFWNRYIKKVVDWLPL
ncbi:MAG: alpha/beta hydrolase [Ruminococcus sp.]